MALLSCVLLNIQWIAMKLTFVGMIETCEQHVSLLIFVLHHHQVKHFVCPVLLFVTKALCFILYLCCLLAHFC